MRLRWALTTAGLIFIAIVAGGCGRDDNAQLVLGAVLPMTGNAAKYGEQMKEGVDLAVEQINAAGGINGKRVRVLVEDGQADAKTSIAAFRKLVSQDHVPGVVSGFSGVILALSPIATETTTVLLNCGATSPEIEGASPFVFSDIPNAKQEATFLADVVFEKFGVRKVAIFWQNNDAGLGMQQLFQQRFEALGGAVVAKESQEPGASDFRAQLNKLKEANPQAIFMPTYSKEFGLAIKQARELGLTCQFFGYAATEVQEMIDLAGSAAEGVVYSYYAYDQRTPTPAARRFLDAYQKKYAHSPNLYSATFYDGILLLADGLAKGHTSGQALRTYLHEMKGFEGSSGVIVFTETGTVQSALRLKTVKDGKFVEYK